MGHYDNDGLTTEDYEKEYTEAESLVFGENYGKAVYCSLGSLEGIVELGKGVDEQHAKETYLENIDNLIEELQQKRNKILYGGVVLDYTSVSEC